MGNKNYRVETCNKDISKNLKKNDLYICETHPNLILNTLSSLGVNVESIFVVASPKFDLIACSNGAKALVSSMKSPKLLS